MTFRRKSAIATVLCLILAAFVSAEEKPWLQVQSPHFRVITNGSPGDARHVAREFEQMRAVFANQFQGFRLDAPAPLLIIAPRDESTAKALLPEFWEHPGPKPAGFYQRGWETEYAVVRLDNVGEGVNLDSYSVVYHEYVQKTRGGL